MVLITGGIFGMGENQEDRISMLQALATLNPTSVPINFYHHNEALPLKPNELSTDEALDLIRLSKEIIPNADRIMVAGGREMMFKDRQTEIFEAGANAIVVGNYLTTSGREKSKDLEMLKNLGLLVASSPDDK
jgi:biotin synthase